MVTPVAPGENRFFAQNESKQKKTAEILEYFLESLEHGHSNAYEIIQIRMKIIYTERG